MPDFNSPANNEVILLALYRATTLNFKFADVCEFARTQPLNCG